MRRIIINEHLSLDGVMQGPGGPEEDTRNGFDLGGWTAAHSDDVSGQTIVDTILQNYDLLLGRFTYDIWLPYWPLQTGPIADKFNGIKKYVATQTLTESSWEGTVFLNGDTIEQIKALRDSDGIDLHIWGSASLVQALLQQGLIDQINLWIYPVILGKGKRLFPDGLVPGAFKLTNHTVSPSSVIFATYQPNGDLELGQSTSS